MRLIATIALTAILGLLFPAPRPALADGAASTRNLLFLGAAAGATYLIIRHNQVVHQREAAMAVQEAQTAQARNDAWAAYAAERHAYVQQVAVNRALQQEVAYQHHVIVAQRRAIASQAPAGDQAPTEGFAGPAPLVASQVANVSYGWGDL